MTRAGTIIHRCQQNGSPGNTRCRAPEGTTRTRIVPRHHCIAQPFVTSQDPPNGP